MINNDVLRSVRYILAVNDARIVEIIKMSDFQEVSEADVISFLKKDDEAGFQECSDKIMAHFLDGLVNVARKDCGAIISQNKNLLLYALNPVFHTGYGSHRIQPLEAITMLAISDITQHINALRAQVPLHTIYNEQEYDEAIHVLNELLDAGGADEHHPLAVLVAMLGDFIADYETRHYPKPVVTGRAMLAFLMEQHGVKQAELPEVGTQGVVSEVLSGKRELTTKHIKALSVRFDMPASVFFGG